MIVELVNVLFDAGISLHQPLSAIPRSERGPTRHLPSTVRSKT